MGNQNKYGYIRVSSKDQNEDRQVLAMEDLDIPQENVYLDRQSGKDFDREQYKAMADRMEEGDLLYIWGT